MNLLPFILYNYPACMVVTLVSSAFVLEQFLIQEPCISDEGKKTLKRKTKPQPTRRPGSDMFVHFKKYLVKM